MANSQQAISAFRARGTSKKVDFMAETNHCINQHKLGYAAVTKKPQTFSSLMQQWFTFHSHKSNRDSIALQDSCPPCSDLVIW